MFSIYHNDEDILNPVTSIRTCYEFIKNYACELAKEFPEKKSLVEMCEDGEGLPEAYIWEDGKIVTNVYCLRNPVPL